jgi:small subunit ribosomal protein S5
MVVAGNGRGVLGLGVGRAAEASDAVRKATAAAPRSLFFVPRHARAGPLAPHTAWHGGVKCSVFPLRTGGGVRACPLAAGVCRLAGVTDVGVKFHGSRCVRHMVKALIRALEGGPTLADAAAAAAAAAGLDGAPRVRELAVGAPRKGRRLAGAPGEWWVQG